MKYKYTFEDIKRFNGGSAIDAQTIINIYLGKGLVEIKSSDHPYHSDILTKKNLILKTRFERISEVITKSDSISGAFAKWSGWLVLVLSQILDVNLIELIKGMFLK